jgi:hypothetical protein
MAVIFRHDPDNPRPQVATRRCPVCDWEGIVVVGSSDEEDCPQCHAPTAIQAPPDASPAGTPAAGATPVEAPPAARTKNPHAAALGRLGGVRGGKARAESLSAKRRKEIARNAALARWRKR